MTSDLPAAGGAPVQPVRIETPDASAPDSRYTGAGAASGSPSQWSLPRENAHYGAVPTHASRRTTITAASAPEAAAPAADQHSGVAPPELPGTVPERSTGVSAGGAGSGFGTSALFAVLIGLFTLAAMRSSKLVIAPVAWRSATVVSQIDPPG